MASNAALPALRRALKLRMSAAIARASAKYEARSVAVIVSRFKVYESDPLESPSAKV